MWPGDCTADIHDHRPRDDETAQATCAIAGVLLLGSALFRKHLAEACRALFRSGDGYPKRKHRYQNPSFRIPQDDRVTHEKLYVAKIGWLRIGKHGGNPYPDSETIKAVVKRIGKRWYATLCHKVLLPVRENDGTANGVDCNLGADRGMRRVPPPAGTPSCAQSTLQTAPA